MEHARPALRPGSSPIWRRLASALGIVLALAFAPAGRAAAETSASEYEIKAAYLLNFTKYVEWPADAAPPAGAPLKVCVLGENPFGSLLETLVRARQSAGRPLTMQYPQDAAAAARDCHIVFLKRDNRERLRRDLAQLSQAPVLTVGDSGEFVADGGVIAFQLEQHRVRLVVNLSAADRAHLKISSRLLSVAQVVER